jgi:uncharacterized protein YjcR
MKTHNNKRSKDFTVNAQLENAIHWLQGMKVVKNYRDVADRVGVSQATVSAYIQRKRPVSGTFAYSFEEMFLRKERMTMKDFELPVLITQVNQLKEHDMQEFVITKITVIEAGVRTILDKLTVLENQNKKLLKHYGELLKLRSKSKPL